MLVWRALPFLFKLLVDDQLSRASPQSRPLANDKGVNEVKPGAVNRSPGIYIMVKENR